MFNFCLCNWWRIFIDSEKCYLFKLIAKDQGQPGRIVQICNLLANLGWETKQVSQYIN